jgi:hypothetical protein
VLILLAVIYSQLLRILFVVLFTKKYSIVKTTDVVVAPLIYGGGYCNGFLGIFALKASLHAASGGSDGLFYLKIA